MKLTLSSLLLSVTAGLPAAASPFTVRTVPAGYSAQLYESVGLHFSPAPVLVDIGFGRKVWYGGGSYFSTFPATSNPTNPFDPKFEIALPVVTMPNFPSVTVSPRAGVPCDVDRDGDMDIVRINSWNGWDDRDTLQVFLNQGSGTFTLGYRFDIDTPLAPTSRRRNFHIASADFDRDGDPDIALLTSPDDLNRETDPWRYEGTLKIFKNDGTGVFNTSTVLQGTGFAYLAAMGVADVDNDGDADILCDDHQIVGSNGTATKISILYRNEGNGTFATFSQGGLRPARLADFNRDGWIDTGYERNTGLNNGAGSIANITQSPGGFYGTAVNDYIYADADGDGKLDCVADEDNRLIYYKGDGTGDFAFAAFTLATLSSPVAAIGAGDSDSDGDTDFFLHLENGTYAFAENRSLHQAAGADLNTADGANLAGVTELHTADFDRDGRDDVLALSPSQKKLWIMLGDDDGVPSGPIVFRNTPSDPHSAAVADFDRDGRIDVAYTLPALGEVRMARNIPGFLIAWPDSVLATGYAGISQLRAGELGTPNGRADLLTGNTAGDLRWFYQSGNAWNTQSARTGISPVPRCILTANGSTRPADDIFTLGVHNETMFLRSFQLNPTWIKLGTDLATPISAPPVAEVMTWADVTGDLKCEIVFVKGDGGLGFWNPITATAGAVGSAPPASIRAIAPVDWDRDGRTDILCATSAGLSIFTWKGTWQREDIFPRPSGFTSVITLDLNHDAWPDAAVASASGGSVEYIYNKPHLLKAVNTSASAVNLLTGQSGTVATASVTSLGMPADTADNSLADVNAVVNEARVHFYKAVPSGNSWITGAAMTPAEIGQAVSTVSFLAGNTVVASSGPALSGGQLTLSHTAGGGTLVPIMPGTSQSIGIRLALTPGAAQSSANRFFIQWSYLEATAQDGLSSPELLSAANVNSVLVTITPALSPLQQWRQNNFGVWESAGNAANNADPDGDGMVNIVEYITSQDPNSFGGLGFSPAIGLTSNGYAGSLIADLRLITTYDSKVKLTIEKSTALQTWTAMSTRVGTGAWTGVVPTSILLGGGGRTRFNFDTGTVPATTAKFYLRLKVEELP